MSGGAPRYIFVKSKGAFRAPTKISICVEPQIIKALRAEYGTRYCTVNATPDTVLNVLSQHGYRLVGAGKVASHSNDHHLVCIWTMEKWPEEPPANALGRNGQVDNGQYPTKSGGISDLVTPPPSYDACSSSSATVLGGRNQNQSSGQSSSLSLGSKLSTNDRDLNLFE